MIEVYAKQGKKVCALNFVSATNPGGGVIHGSSAQEEAICRCSTLYPCLETEEMWNRFYIPHREANFKIAFKPEDVARCYRNLGFYFVEIEEWKIAAGCILMSMQFEKDAKSAQSELYYIATKTNGKLEEPTVEEFERYAEQYGFPFCGDDKVAGLAYALGNQMKNDEMYDGAAYCYEIAYGLSRNDEILAMKEKMESMAEKKF